VKAGEAETDGAEERAEERPAGPWHRFPLYFPLSGYVTSLVLSLVRFISFVTKFLAEGGTGLLPLSPTLGAGRQTGKG